MIPQRYGAATLAPRDLLHATRQIPSMESDAAMRADEDWHSLSNKGGKASWKWKSSTLHSPTAIALDQGGHHSDGCGCGHIVPLQALGLLL